MTGLTPELGHCDGKVLQPTRTTKRVVSVFQNDSIDE